MEPLGRSVEIVRLRGVYHLTVRRIRQVEFAYSIRARRKRRIRWLFDYSSETAVEYSPMVDETYDLRDIRRTNRRNVVGHVIGEYQRRLRSP